MADRGELLFDRERKFLPEIEPLRRFLDTVGSRLTLEVHDAQRPVTWTRSTYLDTKELDHFRSGQAGRLLRMRVRQYAAAPPGGRALLTELCCLELKESCGSIRTKARIQASPRVVQRLIASQGEDEGAWAAIDWAAPSSVDALRRRLRETRLVPCVTTWYRRTAWTALRVRVTLDEEIAFCRPMAPGPAGLEGRPDGVVARGPDLVLEVKTRGETPSWLVHAMGMLPAAPDLSKFRLAMRALHGSALDLTSEAIDSAASAV